MAENVTQNENNTATLDSQSNLLSEGLVDSINSKVLSVFSKDDGMSTISQVGQKKIADKHEQKVMEVIKEITEGNNLELKAVIHGVVSELKLEFQDSSEPMTEEDFFMTAVSTYCEFLEDNEGEEE